MKTFSISFGDQYGPCRTVTKQFETEAEADNYAVENVIEEDGETAYCVEELT